MEENAFGALEEHKCVSLTTYRKNGKPVPTPVLVRLGEGQTLRGNRTELRKSGAFATTQRYSWHRARSEAD